MSALDGFSWYLPLWALVATLTMTSILEASRGFGFSRLSLPFLIGTFFTAQRGRAVILGFVVYTLGGWLFAFVYFLLFASVRIYTWVVRCACRAGPWPVSADLRAAPAAVRASADGIGISFRRRNPAT